MLPQERRNHILSILQQRGSVAVNELSGYFHVSEETIRRDLLQMEQESILTRVHGGAFLSDVVREAVPYNLRRDTEKDAKNQIAMSCLPLIQGGDTLFLDSSTTALYIAERLRELRNITVITNALAIISVLADCADNRVIAIGGELDTESRCFTGWKTVDALSTYHADKAFVSCTGVSIAHGLTDSNEMEGRIRYLMLKNAQKRYLIADTTKFGKTTLTQITGLEMIDAVISDKQLSEEWQDELSRWNIRLYTNANA